jgi:hypothetical protein
VNYVIKTQNQMIVLGNASEALTSPTDSYDTEEGWGANRLKHYKPIFQG